MAAIQVACLLSSCLFLLAVIIGGYFMLSFLRDIKRLSESSHPLYREPLYDRQILKIGLSAMPANLLFVFTTSQFPELLKAMTLLNDICLTGIIVHGVVTFGCSICGLRYIFNSRHDGA